MNTREIIDRIFKDPKTLYELQEIEVLTMNWIGTKRELAAESKLIKEKYKAAQSTLPFPYLRIQGLIR